VLTFVVKRVLATIPVLLGTTFLAFLLVGVAAGDAAQAIAGRDARPETLERIRDELGLNDPLPVRYAAFVGDAVQGDLGRSVRNNRPVTERIGERLPVTVGLVLPTMILAPLVAIPTGVFAAVGRGRRLDRTLTGATAVMLAVPSFALAVILVITFAVRRDWFPAIGYTPPTEDFAEYARGVVLPTVTLMVGLVAELARQTRAVLVETLDQDYVRTARGKGLSRRAIIGKHALKNAGIGIVTVYGLNVAALLGGTILVEQVFAIPGFGSLIYESVLQRDIPLIMGTVVVSVLIVAIANLLVDLSYGYFSPKVRDQR
jgi:peptide/nickel transport system permease protein